MQLLTIQVGDFGEILHEDTLQAMDATETQQVEECFKLSIHAVAETEEGETVCLRALVGNQIILILVDSSSAHSFVNRQFLSRTHLKTHTLPAVTVKLANGELL